MFISIYNSLSMENTSTVHNTPSFVLVITLNVFFAIISNWCNFIEKLFQKFQSFLRSEAVCDYSKAPAPAPAPAPTPVQKSSKNELTQQPISVKKRENGILSRGDVEMVMEELGIFCSPASEELNESFGSDELLGLFEEKEPSLEEVKEAFDVFDQNRDGFIDAKELQRVLCVLGLKQGSELEDCKRMIRTFDQNRDGKIDFHEFFKFMETIFC